MNRYYVDLHVHIGRSSLGMEIKKATANNLTIQNVTYESYHKKGIDVIGAVDCISPFVIEDIEKMVQSGELVELSDGGMSFCEKQIIILGAEIETHEKKGGSAHCLCFFATFNHLKEFSSSMSKYITNIRSNSTMSKLTGQELFNIVDHHGGVLIPAHVFTPHKSFYGNCCKSLHEIFNQESFDKIPAVELGLSADSMMASQMSELDNKSFISNSDAHSLPKIGREYNIFEMQKPSYNEVIKALKGLETRRIVANYGLNPKLGKYNRSYCLDCDRVIENDPPVLKCPVEAKHSIVVGALDRLDVIKDRNIPYMDNRPPYNYQIPLEFIPKVGPKTIKNLIDHFGTEMKILHDASFDDLATVVKTDIAQKIILGREGKLHLEAGGGGVYGRVEKIK